MKPSQPFLHKASKEIFIFHFIGGTGFDPKAGKQRTFYETEDKDEVIATSPTQAFCGPKDQFLKEFAMVQ